MTQLNSNTKESKFITLKYILGVLLILASIGAIAQSKILSAIFYTKQNYNLVQISLKKM